MGVVKVAGKFVLDTFFPIECLGCQEEGEWLCDRCARRIGIEDEDVCIVCKARAQNGHTCFSCKKICALDAVMRFLDYDDLLVRRLLQAAKYGYVQQALHRLLDTVEPHIKAKLEMLEFDARAFVYVPVPLHPRRLRDRGFNQSEIIAGRVAGAVGAAMAPILKRKKDRPPQAKLDEFDRAVNIKDNIRCINPAAVNGKYVCLVDDVTTTGSTLDECARTLRDAGAQEVWGLVLAKG